ncbi:MAG: aldehyde dehydrogenase [Flammeovirgaceae bacterium]
MTQEVLEQNVAQALIQKQREYFRTGVTHNVSFRIKQLKALKAALKKREDEVYEALALDFRKSTFETYISEIGMVYEEINLIIKHLRLWSEPEKVDTPITLHPGSSYIYRVPYGVTLIIGAWNYPFQLTVVPLVGAIAAGNCAILKPSELSPNTSRVIAEMMAEIYEEDYVTVVEGGVAETQQLLAERFDYIFFTGSVRVGQIVAQAASKYLTPFTLELGGKSPCIVHKDASIDKTAKRLVWGKFLNGGQTCVAPDYVLAHKDVKEELIFKMKKYIANFYGTNPKESPDFPRIINERHFDRLTTYLMDGKLVAGGETDKAELYIAPTILDDIGWDDPIMQDEIFGPILPIITYENINRVVEEINNRPKPLAFYVFTEKKSIGEQLLKYVDFGGGCLNDTITHLGNLNLPFGGVGSSGSGAYHGKFSFETFSHQKGVHKKTTWIDVPLRYPPYEGKLGLIKTIIK